MRQSSFRFGGSSGKRGNLGFASQSTKIAHATVEQATATAASLAEAEVLRAAAAAPPDHQTIGNTTQLAGHVLPIAAALWNEDRQHILSCDAETLRLWTTERELRRVALPRFTQRPGMSVAQVKDAVDLEAQRSLKWAPNGVSHRPNPVAVMHCEAFDVYLVLINADSAALRLKWLRKRTMAEHAAGLGLTHLTDHVDLTSGSGADSQKGDDDEICASVLHAFSPTLRHLQRIELCVPSQDTSQTAGAPINCATFSQRRATLVTADDAHAVCLWIVRENVPSRASDGGGATDAGNFQHSHHFATSSGFAHQSVPGLEIHPVLSADRVAVFSLDPGLVQPVTFLCVQDERNFVFGASGPHVMVWDLADRLKDLCTLNNYGSDVKSICYDAKNDSLIAGHVDGSCIAWDLVPPASIEEHEPTLSSNLNKTMNDRDAPESMLLSPATRRKHSFCSRTRRRAATNQDACSDESEFTHERTFLTSKREARRECSRQKHSTRPDVPRRTGG
jgi:hypothetical protein